MEDEVIEQLKKLQEQQTDLGEFKVDFPDVQKVEVTNFPEQKDPVVNVNVPEVKVPPIKAPEVKIPDILIPETVVNVEKPDLTELAELMAKQSELLKRIAEKEVPDFDYSKFDQIAGRHAYRGGAVSTKNTVQDGKTGRTVSFGGFISTLNSTTETLGAAASYTGTWEDITDWGSISIIGTATANATLYADFSTDGSTTTRTVQLSTGTDTSLGIHSLIPVAKYFRVRVTDSGSGSNAIVIQTLFHHNARIAQPTSRLNQNLSEYLDVLNTRSIIANVNGTNANVTNHRSLQVTPPSEGKTAFGEALVGQLVDQVILDFAYGLNTDLVVTRTNQSGTVTGANALATISSGAAANSEARLSSKEICRYVPGHGARARFTSIFTTGVAGNTQTAGIGDTSNGFFFGYNGTSFGVLHRRDGKPEVRTLTVTTASSDAEDITITLDGDATATVSVTASSNTTTTANEIAAHDYSDVGRGWTATALGATVVFESWSSETQTGTYSLSSATSAVGSFAQNVAGTAPTETWTAQASWNGDDKFDGNGITGETLDPTKGNVFQIDYQWLGFGAVYFYIEDPDDGELHNVHTIQYANANTTPSLSIPSQPFTIASVNTSNTSDVSISSSSAGCFVDGVVEFIGPRKAVDAAKDFGAANAELPILSVDNKVYYQSNINRIAAKGIAISAASTGGKSVTWKVLKNATLTDASFTDISTATSVLQKDTSASAYSGGTEIAAFSTGAGSSVVITSGDNNDLLIEPGETITVTADPTANNSDVSVSIRFIELF